MNSNGDKLNHSRWECKYHVVFIPKWRKKVLYSKLRKLLGVMFHELARQKESRIEEGHIMVDHVHMMISIPPKYSVSQVIGFMKGKSSIQIARKYLGRDKNYTGYKFWARGYYVSTVGRDEEMIRNYIRNQDKADRISDQIGLFE